MKDTVLNFGKHKGQKIADIEPSYLEWLKKTLEPGKFNNDQVLAAIEEVLGAKATKKSETEKETPYIPNQQEDDNNPF